MCEDNQKCYPMQWNQAQRTIVCGLFLIGKTFQEISDEINKYIEREARGYRMRPYRSDRAIAFQCNILGLLSEDELKKWDARRTKKRIKDREKDYYKVRQKVFKRDENKCVICSSLENLHFSHIIPFRQTRLNIEIEAITLCGEHHKKFDNNDNNITKIIFSKMCEYYEDYKQKYSLIESGCEVHGMHVLIERKN